jgi:hypothetical protein
MMLLRPLAFVVVALAGLQAVPGTSALVASATRYVEQYQRDFAYLVADEQATQEVIDRDGVVTAARETRGELFAAFLQADRVWMSVHDVETVDGAPVPPGDDVRTMLRSESFRAVASRVAAANARYNIGSVTRNFNEPTLALLYFAPDRVDGVKFDRGAVDRSTPGLTLVTLRMRGRDDRPLVRSPNGRVTMRGSVVVDGRTGCVRHTSLAFSDGKVDADLDTTYALDRNVSVWVPVQFVERYRERASGETTTVRTSLGNYRRFETSGRIIVP